MGGHLGHARASITNAGSLMPAGEPSRLGPTDSQLLVRPNDCGRILTLGDSVAGAVLILAAFCAVLALLLPNSLFQLALAGALLGSVVMDGILSRAALKQVELEFETPVLGHVHEDVSLVVRLRNHTRPLRMELVESWGRRFYVIDDTTRGIVLTQVPQRVRVRYLDADLICPGPLGVMVSRRRVRSWFAQPLSVTVRPLPYDVDWPQESVSWVGDEIPSRRGSELVRGVRPYERGDPRRQVHWKATAHQGSLMVKEADGYASLLLRVVVHLPPAGPVADWVVARAEYVLGEASNRGYATHLVTMEVPDAEPPDVDVQVMTPYRTLIPAGPPVTVAEPVRSARQWGTRLAAACPGHPAASNWAGPTLHLSPEPDRWE